MEEAGGKESTREHVERELAAWICEILEVPEVAVDVDLFEAGLDSPALTVLYGRIRQFYPNKVRLQDLFDYRTIAELAGRIAEGETAEDSAEESVREIEF